MVITSTKIITNGTQTKASIDITDLTKKEYKKLCQAVRIASANDTTFDRLLARLQFVGVYKEIII